MPLIKSWSAKDLRKNIRELLKSWKKKKQSIAIALDVQNRYK